MSACPSSLKLWPPEVEFSFDLYSEELYSFDQGTRILLAWFDSFWVELYSFASYSEELLNSYDSYSEELYSFDSYSEEL